MRIIMTGGGTGGHIYPAIAIADKIKRRHKDAEILFVGTEKGMEREIVPQNGYEIVFITISGFDRRNPLKNIKTLKELYQSDKQSRKIIENFKPDVVIGTGGYVCGPVVRAAHKMGIPTYIHEQNACPGMTNKLLEKYVQRIFVSFAEAKSYFKNQDKILVTGNPVRKSFMLTGVTDFREKFNIGKNDFAILCFGGSRGAGMINKVMIKLIDQMQNLNNIKIFFITGKIYYDNILQSLSDLGVSFEDKITIMPYAENMHEYMHACDLIISRSGALTVSEITACGKASILIPSPNVTGNHQYFNAKVVADKGGAVLIEEKELQTEALYSVIMRLMNNKQALNQMSEVSAKIGRFDAADVIYDNLNLR